MNKWRKSRRYDLSLPVIIRVPVKKNASSRNRKTRNVSTRDVYFTIDNYLSTGTNLDLTLPLPSEVTGGTEVLIRAIGKVIRVDKRSANGDRLVGITAVTERYDIVRNEPAIE
jgi:hypothetical protein